MPKDYIEVITALEVDGSGEYRRRVAIADIQLAAVAVTSG